MKDLKMVLEIETGGMILKIIMYRKEVIVQIHLILSVELKNLGKWFIGFIKMVLEWF